MTVYKGRRQCYAQASKEGSVMDDHQRVRQKPTDVKVHIRTGHSTLMITGIPGERKANARKNCTGKRNML